MSPDRRARKDEAMDHGVPAHELSDAELERQGVHAHATRHWVFLHGTQDQFRTHTQRMLELEQEYLRRHPQRTWQGAASSEGQPPAEERTEVVQSSRIRDLVHTFVREIDYLLGPADDEADGSIGPAELRLLARVAAAPDRRMHKLEVHQAARELGSPPRSLALLYKSEPPLMRADGDHREITEAGLRRIEQREDATP